MKIHCGVSPGSFILNTNKLINFCRKNDHKIIFITHIREHSDKEFIKGSKNVEIVDEIDKIDSGILIKKNKISPFF